MTVTPFILLILMFSSGMCLFMNSWLSIWLMLEMNTLAFCCLLKDFSYQKKMMTESSLKYFIIQSITSSLLVFVMAYSHIMKKMVLFMFLMATFSLAIKMAAAPLHQWFVELTKKMDFKNATLLLTWQKLAPVFLLIYQMKIMVFPFLALSAFVGVASQINKPNVMEVMALSSVFNLSWMTTAIFLSTKLFILFSFMYWTTVMLTLIMIHSTKMKNINSESNDKSKKWMYFMVIINLAGIPPLLGFLAKWMVFMEMTTMKIASLATLLLVSSSINLYIYMRMTNYLLLKNYDKVQKSNKYFKKLYMSMLLAVNVSPLVVVSV